MARTTDLGTIGRLHVYSDINHDRKTPSTQVWVEFMKDGKVFGTASGNCAVETGEIECDNGKAYRLSASEMAKLEAIMEQHEGVTVEGNLAMKVKPSELNTHPDIREAVATEIATIDEEIAELRRNRRELLKIASKVRTVGRRAWLAMNNPNGQPQHSACYGPASRLRERVRDIRGYHSGFYRAIQDRQIDLWVTLGGVVDLSGITMGTR